MTHEPISDTELCSRMLFSHFYPFVVFGKFVS